MRYRGLALTMMVLMLTACDPGGTEAGRVIQMDPSRDYFTHANTAEFQSRHLALDLKVDFDRRVLEGQVIHLIERLDETADTIVLDSRGLRIHSVQLARPEEKPLDLEFELGPPHPVKGEALTIRLPDGDIGHELQLTIAYRTGSDASAIMWLPSRLTAGGAHPFMFTQSQSIHARSWIPLQDTPSVRISYQATIRTPPDLVAVMSADNDPSAPRNGEFQFEMPQPIPSYLMALAVGHLKFEPFGENTGVFAEPQVLEAAAWEFTDTQAMLDAAEEIYGPYQWGRYDLLILPPSFPFGGMENPRLSFITPSVLAGDRSLVSLIAHELAHSWSGNLVSNRTWRDIWLNEGTTSYLEARLMEVLYGKERADEERLLVYQSLLEDLKVVPIEMQPLAPEFTSGDPDEGQMGMEYAKGQMMLEHLEGLFGREVFDEFLTDYFDHFAFQAISSEEFLEYADANLLQKHPGVFSRAGLEEWLYQPGLPADLTVPESRNLEKAAAAAKGWAMGEIPVNSLPSDEWSPQAVVYFLKALPEFLSEDQLKELDRHLGLSGSLNAEIARAWFIQVAQRKHQPAYDAMRDYLGRYGRTRLIEPVYAALVRNGRDREMAKRIFAGYRENYHPLTIDAIAVLFGEESAE